MPDAPPSHTITTESELRELLGAPSPIVCAKVVDRLTALTRSFVAHAPLVILATSDETGAADASPRGDPAGFVRVLDDRTLLIPERPGNRIADSLRNILKNPRIGLLFVIPGVGDTFRVNGRATLTTDPALLAPSAVEGVAPRLGVRVEIEQAFTQCSKAFVRADCWNPERFLSRADLPSSGAILREILGETFDAAAHDRERADRYARRVGFY